ncbi:hypothetical protein [Dyella caseinilytica]|uniref:Phage Mu protein F like protein n=1 Tax=Dyella caseinilytica TaxID=1849581 RepID=A0ABX7GZ55_9GAMM|nr:hypothetical protein [Dyella caseinilytica]QRN55246.1 hypothetical protein ISN74_07925 [Dyella caseinilytica]GGA00388.1 hypothetical protein GCM10011408_21640 [Dyella caseinilytica]
MASTFRKALEEAVAYYTEYGYGSSERLSDWMRRLYAVARQDSPSPEQLQKRMKMAMETYFKRATSYTTTRRKHPGVPRYTIQQIEPRLRPELSRRIQASADLIKLNRDQAIEKTMQRFAGWATSVPSGGSNVVAKGEVKQDIAKSLRQLSFVERRVAIDQGHKLVSNVNAIIAEQGQAIAGMWRSHWRRPGYDYRPDHKERDQKVFALRGNWAMQSGLMNKGAGYMDEMTAAGEEPFCECYVVYFYNLRDLPADMLTNKGRSELERTRIKVA